MTHKTDFRNRRWTPIDADPYGYLHLPEEMDVFGPGQQRQKAAYQKAALSASIGG